MPNLYAESARLANLLSLEILPVSAITVCKLVEWDPTGGALCSRMPRTVEDMYPIQVIMQGVSC